MPGHAGSHLRFYCKIVANLDSDLRRNDMRESGPPFAQFELARLQFLSAYHRLRIQLVECDSREFSKQFAS